MDVLCHQLAPSAQIQLRNTLRSCLRRYRDKNQPVENISLELYGIVH